MGQIATRNQAPPLSPLPYLVLSIFAFYPCLFHGQAYFDNDLLAQFGPWRAFLKDQLASGHFPLWNPFNLGGQPFFADLQNMMLYPFNWLTLPFSVPLGLSLFFALHLFWAALGMDRWLGSLGLSGTARWVGALLFALSNFFWMEIIHPPVIAAFAWLPWFFYYLEGLARGPKPRSAFFAGLSFAMLFLCGSFQMTVGAFYGGLFYFLGRLFGNGRAFSFKKALLLSLLFLWGALPLLGQLIPTAEFAKLSDRGAAGQTYDQSNARLPLDPRTLHQFLLPRFTLPKGESMAEAIQFGNDKGETRLAANLGYLGVWLPFLLVLALRGKEERPVKLLAALAVVGLLISFGRYTPLHRAVCHFLPGFSTIRVPYRFLFLYILPASALAAIGFEKAFALAEKKGALSSRLICALLYSGILYAVALLRPGLTWRELLGLALGLAAFFGASLAKKWAPRLGALALLLPLFLTGWDDFRPEPASNFDFAGRSKGVLEAGRSVLPDRVLFLNSQMGYPVRVGGRDYVLNYPQNAACALGIKNFGGYNPLSLKVKGDIGTLPLKPLIQLGAIGGVLVQGVTGEVPGFKKESYPPYILYRHRGPLPYAYAPYRLRIMPGPQAALAALGSPDFDAAKDLVLTGPASRNGGPFFFQEPPRKLECHLVEDKADRQVFLLELDRDSHVVFCEVAYPGWKASVDGTPARVQTADLFLRAVHVPGGKHWVEFRFEPWWLDLLKAGLAIWLLVTGWVLLKTGILRNPFYLLLQGLYYAVGGLGLGRIKILRALYNALFQLFRPKKVMVLGHTMWLDDKDTLELGRRGIYEPFETELFQKVLKPGMTVVDVGANIGYYTLLAARRVGPKGRVLAFEPDPVNYGLLRKNLEVNGYRNVALVNQALSNKKGKAKLYLNPANRGDHRVYDSGDGRRSVTIRTAILDSFIGKKKVDLIKMDIQGAEALALAGMKRTIRSSKGLKLFTEFSPESLKKAGSDPKRYLAALTALGFKLSEISEKDGKLIPVTPAQLLKRDWKNGAYTNLLGMKK